MMGKGAFPINLFPHRAWWGFAVQLRVGDWVVWGGWERLGLTQSLPLQENCSSICKIPVWDLRGFCVQCAGEGWGQGQDHLPCPEPLCQAGVPSVPLTGPWGWGFGSCELKMLFKSPVLRCHRSLPSLWKWV